MREGLIKTVERIVEEKEKAGISPAYARMPEVIEAVKEELRELCREKALACRLNVNGVPMFEILKK